MTVRTAYPYRTLRLWTSGDQPVLDVWLGYTPVDAEPKSNRTFIVRCVCRPKIPGLLELAWPVPAWFTNRVFAENCEIVEMEQSAYNHQGRVNQEAFPPIRDLRKLLAESGQLPGYIPPVGAEWNVPNGYWPSLFRSHQSVFMRLRRVRSKSGSRFDGVLSKPLSLFFGRALVSARGNRR
jgi:hypothetical protein